MTAGNNPPANHSRPSEEVKYENFTYVDHIKTVELYRSGWQLSAPIRNLRDTSSLILEFDDLDPELHHYTYTLIHCASDWQPSGILNTEYLTGLPECEIRDYRYSRNALQPYRHYRLELPNEECGFRIPGNYLLFVFDDYDRSRPVLTRRFFILERLVNIEADVHRTDNLDFLNSSQEVDFRVSYEMLQPNDPKRDFRVTVCQNLNPATAITELMPKYIREGELIYDYEEENLFQGGAEFLHFDTKSLRFNSDRIKEIRFERPLQHVYLKTDYPDPFSSYRFQEDLNGRYLVKWDDAFDSDTEADYVMVHFSLRTDSEVSGGEVYLNGTFTDWGRSPGSICRYNPSTLCYENTLILKQGYYNYSFALTGGNEEAAGLNEFTGSHYETENDYYIFVYYRDIRERFDRLVGVKTANSVRMPENN